MRSSQATRASEASNFGRTESHVSGATGSRGSPLLSGGLHADVRESRYLIIMRLRGIRARTPSGRYALIRLHVGGPFVSVSNITKGRAQRDEDGRHQDTEALNQGQGAARPHQGWGDPHRRGGGHAKEKKDT